MRFFISTCLLLALACAPGAAPESDISVGPSHASIKRTIPPDIFADAVPGRFVVKLKDSGNVREEGLLSTGDKDTDEALGRMKIRKFRRVHRHGNASGLYAIDADGDNASLESLSRQPGVEWVEPVRNYALSGFTDPYYKYQWNMSELQLEQVHARTQGQGVIVAVVDSGVSPGSDGPSNVLPGWDFMDDDGDARDSAAATQSSQGSHGTHVAGTIAQASNNGIGVTGIAPMAMILPVRVGDYRTITSEHIAEGIEWAVDHGAQVINISIGGSSPTRVIEEACKYAYDHGVVVVAATGNDGYDGKVAYPAAYPNVIAVGAHDGNLHETSYSNHGRQLAILAPGGDTSGDTNHDGQPDGILQGTITSKGWGYAMFEGTSMAAPHVAGAAAILISAGVTGPDAVRAALLGGATQVNGLPVLNILGALNYQGGPAPVASAPVAPEPEAPAPEKPAREARREAREEGRGHRGGAAGRKGNGEHGVRERRR